MIVVGLDCGGSSTRAEAILLDGTVAFEGTGGPSNWASTPRDQLKESLASALAGVPNFESGVCAMAGILTESDADGAKAIFTELGYENFEVVPDFHASLRACNSEDAVCVISGTGSIISSFYEGSVVKSGGGGPLLGDCGSGFYCGRLAIQKLLEPGCPAQFVEVIQPILDEEFGTSAVNDVLAEIYRSRKAPAPKIARVGSKIAALATDNEMCHEIVIANVELLVTQVKNHILCYPPINQLVKVFRAGGFWASSPVVREHFEVQLGLETAEIPLSPVRGASLLAINRIEKQV